MTIKSLISAAAATALVAGTALPAAADNAYDVLEKDAGAFAILTLLLKQAGLESALTSGEVTVFAPTDEAFGKLPDEVLLALLDPANGEALRTVLQNHVVEGLHTADKFVKQRAELQTTAGEALTIEGNGELYLQESGAPFVTNEGGRIVLDYAEIEAHVPLVRITSVGGTTPGAPDDNVDGAVVVLPDISADNAVIHAVSEVLVPQSVAVSLN